MECVCTCFVSIHTTRMAALIPSGSGRKGSDVHDTYHVMSLSWTQKIYVTECGNWIVVHWFSAASWNESIDRAGDGKVSLNNV